MPAVNEAIARAFEVQPNFSLTEFELIATAAMHRSSSFAAAMAWAPVIKHAGRTEFEVRLLAPMAVSVSCYVQLTRDPAFQHEINATINDIPTKTARGTFDRYLPSSLPHCATHAHAMSVLIRVSIACSQVHHATDFKSDRE